MGIAIIVVLAAVVFPAVAGACPLCKEASSDADTPGGTTSLGLGFYYSILLMVAAPFLVAGTLAFAIVRSRRRRRAGRAGARGAALTPTGEARP